MANASEWVKLSASTKGRGIKIAANATPGTLVHQTPNHATKVDRIWLYLYNSHTADVLATIELGGTTDPDDTIKVTIPFKAGKVLVLDGDLLIDAAGGALDVRVFGATANVLVAFGRVSRITP